MVRFLAGSDATYSGETALLSAWEASIIGLPAQSQPFNTITGPTLDVTATTNYSADTIDDVTAITFDTTAASTATFLATQFGNSAIASDATITGDSHKDNFDVRVGHGKTFDGAQLQFADWATSDKFEITAAGDHATITGTSANDTIDMGAFYDTTDVINGGTGSSTLELDGSYTTYVDISAAMFQNIDTIELTGDSTYDLEMNAGVVAAGKTITINASDVGAGGETNLDLANDTTGSYVIDLGEGDNFVILNDQADTVHCSGGSNNIYVIGVLPALDKIVGAGNTNLVLSGDYSAGYTFGAHQLSGPIALYLESGYSYDLTMNNANVPTGRDMVVNGSAIGTSNSFTFNGSHVTGGSFDIFGGAGMNELTGSSYGSNSFLFTEGNLLTAADRIDGGSGGNNYLDLSGNYSGGFKFQNATIENIQQIFLESGNSYNLTLASGNDLSGQTLAVDGQEVGAGNSLVFDGSKVAGNLVFYSGTGSNIFIGGSGTNTFYGGAGDMMTGGSGANHFDYTAVNESTSTTYDTITGFNASTDTIGIDFGATPQAIDPEVTTGTLSSASFDANLASAIGAGQLHAGDAVLFTPNAGTLAGHTFLIVDENGVAGYQAGADLVIELNHATNLSQFSTSDFT